LEEIMPPEILTNDKLCKLLNIDPKDLPDLSGHHRDVEALKSKVRQFRKVIRSAWRRLATEDHPDKGGTGEKLKAAAPVYKWIMDHIKVENVKIMRPRPRPTIIRMYTSYSDSTSTTGSTTSSTGFWHWR
jgi:hypothetical protein